MVTGNDLKVNATVVKNGRKMDRLDAGQFNFVFRGKTTGEAAMMTSYSSSLSRRFRFMNSLR